MSVPMEAAKTRSAAARANAVRCGAGLLLGLSIATCSSAPPRDARDIDTGHYNIELARMYMEDKGVPRDDTKAFYLLSNASVAGDIDAKELLGRLYAEGRGVPRDDELATNLFRNAVDGGNVAALSDLGQMIETGRGTPADPDAALGYYERGMDAGDPKARKSYQRLKKSLETPPPETEPDKAVPQITTQALPPPS